MMKTDHTAVSNNIRDTTNNQTGFGVLRGSKAAVGAECAGTDTEYLLWQKKNVIRSTFYSCMGCAHLLTDGWKLVYVYAQCSKVTPLPVSSMVGGSLQSWWLCSVDCYDIDGLYQQRARQDKIVRCVRRFINKNFSMEEMPECSIVSWFRWANLLLYIIIISVLLIEWYEHKINYQL